MNIIRNSIKGAAVLLATAFVMAGCQRESLADSFGIQSDQVVKFMPTLSGGSGDARSKGELYNESGSDKSLGAYVDSFMVVAWNTPEGSDPAKVIPDETALAFGTDFITNGYQKVKKRTGAGGTEYWMTVQPQLYTEVAGAPEQADDEYIWKSGETKTFFAYANLPSSGASVTYADAPGQTLSYTEVPDDAAAQTDILLGFYKGEGKVGTGESAKMTGTASIKFHHPLTAVKFVRGTMDDEYVISSISLEGVAESGTATMNIVERVAPKDDTVSISWTDIASYEHTVSQSKEDGLSVDGTSNLVGEPFIIIPQNVGTNHVTVTVTLTNGMSGSTTIESGIWLMGYTNTYTINFGGSPETGYSLSITEWDENAAGDIELDSKDYQYEFKVTEDYIVFSNTTDSQTKTFQIESYRHLKGDDIIANREPIAYSAEYSTDGGTTWQPFDADATAATGLSGLGATSEGCIKASDINLVADPKVVGGTKSAYRWVNDGIQAEEWDLSCMQIGGEGDGTADRNTANCYIVKHPGTYKLPCVYGNSIQNGVATDKGYKVSASSTNSHMLQTFLNAKGTGISNAWVLSDLSASLAKVALLWCDALDDSDNKPIIKNVTLTGTGSDAYIHFETASKDKLIQGNAVVVLYDDSNSNDKCDDGEALWSWHIWITDADLSTDNIGYVSDDVKFMSRNLGWTDDNYVWYKGRDDVLIRLTQNNSANVQYITARQPEFTGDLVDGSCPYYEWGRKDPFVGSAGFTADNKPFYDASGNAMSFKNDDDNSVFQLNDENRGENVVKNSVRYPMTFAYNNTYDVTYTNLWSVNNIGLGIEAAAIVIDKSVYDPCPFGYEMPNADAFSEFNSETFVVLASQTPCRVFNYDDNLLFPAVGARICGYSTSSPTPPNKGALWLDGNRGLYWTAVPREVSGRCGYALRWSFSLNAEDMEYTGNTYKCNAFPVRPVLEK